LHAQGRLRDVQFMGCPAETQLIGNGDEEAQLLQFHDSSSV
jgi:hypothetical protein